MPDPPRTVGRYQIRAELGRGTMGVVYRAHDGDLGRDVALKVIRASLEGPEAGAGFEQRFFNEARAAARLSHPAIVVVHDVGRDPDTGSLFMALELLRGRTLQAVIGAEAPLPWPRALALIESVAEALHHAHEGGIVHRDVKPANIMVLDSGEPKIMDFGIAKVEASQLTATGQLFGTPLYMSPEQALSRPVDSRSDLFSLGSVLYEMLTGRRAFAGDSVPSIVLQVAQWQPPPPSSVVAGLPGDVDYLVARCLAKDPDRRYPNGRALAAEVRDVRSGVRPRGRDAWESSLDAAATLVSKPPAPPGARGPSPARAVKETLSGLVLEPVPAAGAGGSRARVLAAAALLALAAGVGYLARGGPGPAGPTTRPDSETTAPLPAEAPSAPAALPPSPSAPADGEGAIGRALGRVTSLLTAPEPARVTLDLEHSLKSGTLRVWVDEKAVVEQALDSRVAMSFAGLKLRKGHLRQSLELEPGRHQLKVQLAWDDNVKSEVAWGNFKAGSTRRLDIRLRGVGGLRDLSLQWH